jgi:hypothetical protein
MREPDLKNDCFTVKKKAYNFTAFQHERNITIYISSHGWGRYEIA